MNFNKYIILLLSVIVLVSAETKASEECFEGTSRAIFKFNMVFDNAILEPIAKGYNKLPEPIKNGTSNFTSNIATLLSIPNHLAQGNIRLAGDATASFLINSTVGIIGLANPAQKLGLKAQKEDVGQTLGTYGVGPGCYLVLPVLGPSTARDTVASIGNFVGGDAWYNVTVRNDTQYFSDFDYYTSKVTSGVDFRAKNFDSIENLEKNSLDFYASVKSLYLQDRQQKILNTSKITKTQNDSDWEEFD